MHALELRPVIKVRWVGWIEVIGIPAGMMGLLS